MVLAMDGGNHYPMKDVHILVQAITSLKKLVVVLLRRLIMWNEIVIFAVLSFFLSGITFYTFGKALPACSSNACKLMKTIIILSSAIVFARIVTNVIVNGQFF